MYDNRCSSLRVPLCSICHLPVPVNEAKTDEDGEAVHGDCYLSKLGVTKHVRSLAKVAKVPSEFLYLPQKRYPLSSARHEVVRLPSQTISRPSNHTVFTVFSPLGLQSRFCRNGHDSRSC